ncbi:MAG: methylenetetrahydrofolate reductase C-terminal domain-containing protein [Thermodesulfobacteriota bacterium]|nr:methylenetetrahydrofolate reductase C-terminal domain-containing protein [Thermodesulfobacteriota bacterium]
MIKAEQKPLEEILLYLKPYDRILLSGCGACVTVCQAGGEKEVGLLASALRMARTRTGKLLEVLEATPARQCEPEFATELSETVEKVEAVLSVACGVGVQTLARHFQKTPVFPGVNTTFLGETVTHGVWEERCQACGNCILERTGGICPVARCAKQLFNGPCGGSSKGKCEIKREADCAWQLIYDRLNGLGQLYRMEEIIPARRWGVESRDSGLRRIVREDLKV